jgi:hypothetical protein
MMVRQSKKQGRRSVSRRSVSRKLRKSRKSQTKSRRVSNKRMMRKTTRATRRVMRGGEGEDLDYATLVNMVKYINDKGYNQYNTTIDFRALNNLDSEATGVYNNMVKLLSKIKNDSSSINQNIAKKVFNNNNSIIELNEVTFGGNIYLYPTMIELIDHYYNRYLKSKLNCDGTYILTKKPEGCSIPDPSETDSK